MSTNLKVVVILLITAGLFTFLCFKSQQIPPQTDSHGHNNTASDTQCPGKFVFRQILIRDNQFFPNEIDVEKCTIVEFVNYDKVDRQPIFGVHDEHIHYPGFEEAVLNPGQHTGFVAIQPGTYNFHDHYDENMQGMFVVR